MVDNYDFVVAKKYRVSLFFYFMSPTSRLSIKVIVVIMFYYSNVIITFPRL
jgi:hypothetical protein